MKRSDFDIWFDKFQPDLTESGELKQYETYEEDLEKILSTDYRYVWTLIEGDSGKLYISPGKRLVNRMNYFICKIPHKNNQRDYLY